MCLAIPGQIVSTELPEDAESMLFGKVRFGGITKMVNLSLVPDAGIGDYVLVHVGVAISKVDEAEAQRTLRFLEGMGELDELKIDENLHPPESS